MKNSEHFEKWLNNKRASSSILSEDQVYKIPVVVHVLHRGDSIGKGLNFPKERIESQIRILNEDFRRKENTPGFNSNPDGNDSQIEFILAQVDPNGFATDGIDRIDLTKVHISSQQGDIIQLCAAYSYWDPEQYLNVWCLGGDSPSPILGFARFPISDLDGLPDTEYSSDGVWVDAYAFGSGDANNYPNYDMGRTLTHEIGHFLGLLHTWGSIGNSRQCDSYTDYCDDTPPIPVATSGCPSEKPIACDGRVAMIENYMDGSYDQCMNIFTKDQIARMHMVLNNSPRRKSLLTSNVIDRTDDVTGIDKIIPNIQVFPNPATEAIYISADNETDVNIQVTAYSLLGQELFSREGTLTQTAIEIPLPVVNDSMIMLIITAAQSTSRHLIKIE